MGQPKPHIGYLVTVITPAARRTYNVAANSERSAIAAVMNAGFASQGAKFAAHKLGGNIFNGRALGEVWSDDVI